MVKERKCTFIGYMSDEIRYNKWDNHNKKVVGICGVVFNESVLYKDENTKIHTKEKQLEKKIKVFLCLI